MSARVLALRHPRASAPDPERALLQQLAASLRECVAWMDAPQRATDLSRAVVDDARRVLLAAEELTRG
ncbi:MAG: hypothetical protein IT460_15320 [Planctomycetes bacterium]|nr:hypothetical protein [Planctomycetota bacterium]